MCLLNSFNVFQNLLTSDSQAEQIMCWNCETNQGSQNVLFQIIPCIWSGESVKIQHNQELILTDLAEGGGPEWPIIDWYHLWTSPISIILYPVGAIQYMIECREVSVKRISSRSIGIRWTLQHLPHLWPGGHCSSIDCYPSPFRLVTQGASNLMRQLWGWGSALWRLMSGTAVW